jgi:hypothetical protein
MELFSNGEIVVFEDNCNRFIYELAVTVKFENTFSTPLIKYYSSDKFLKIVNYKKLTDYISLESSLYSAPKKWLFENNFIKYEKPIKKKRIYKKKIDGIPNI